MVLKHSNVKFLSISFKLTLEYLNKKYIVHKVYEIEELLTPPPTI